MSRSWFALVLISSSLISGCSKPAESPDSIAPVSANPAAVSTPEPPPAPAAEPAVALPEELPSAIHVWADIRVIEANTVNAGENKFEIKAETRKSIVQVMNYYIQYFRENGWEEDMIMEHEGNTVVSFKKDGILQYVDATEGGGGSYVTITTGNY